MTPVVFLLSRPYGKISEKKTYKYAYRFTGNSRMRSLLCRALVGTQHCSRRQRRNGILITTIPAASSSALRNNRYSGWKWEGSTILKHWFTESSLRIYAAAASLLPPSPTPFHKHPKQKWRRLPWSMATKQNQGAEFLWNTCRKPSLVLHNRSAGTAISRGVPGEEYYLMSQEREGKQTMLQCNYPI